MSTGRTRDDVVVRRMAELMKAGATLLPHACPVCGTPLLRLKSGEVYCARCEKRVFIVKSETEERGVVVRAVLEDLRDTIAQVLSALTTYLKTRPELDQGERMELGREVLLWLEALEKVNRLLEEVTRSG